MSGMQPEISALGDSAITITLSRSVSPDSTAHARDAAATLRAAKIAHVEEVVSAYTAVTVFYDSLHVSFDELSKRLLETLQESEPRRDSAQRSRLHTIRVVYDGVDLADVAAAIKLTVADVVAIHSSQTYTVDVLGFVPGFAYLSELDARLELPRRPQPRQRVPAGSVAIASRLTGIYPFDTPGGWHILGRTDAVMFDPRRAEPALFKAGDRIRFEPVT
jgi:inhibitor of KinA